MNKILKNIDKIISLVIILILSLSEPISAVTIVEKFDQVLYVVGTGGYKAKVSLYEKKSSGGWNQIISTNGYVGKNGISDNKKEGDGKTPSGVYDFGTAFGIAKNPGSIKSYRQINNNDYWVDDPNSKYYNQWVDITKVNKDWKSAEHLISENIAYKYGVVVNYNTNPIIPGNGSAIFLHVSTNGPTAGCISVSEDTMVNILKVLKPNAKIVISKDKNSIPKPPQYDILGHWAEDNIRDFMEKGYVGGYSDGSFKPNNNITRAEFVKILNKVLGLTKSSGKVFSDTKTHWAKHDIDIAVTNGVCNGKTTTEFKPNDAITREEAAVMISNYKKIADNNFDKINKYKDASKVASWAKPGVEGIIEKGYMSGYSDNTYRPKNKITRAEAVATLSRIK